MHLSAATSLCPSRCSSRILLALSQWHCGFQASLVYIFSLVWCLLRPMSLNTGPCSYTHILASGSAHMIQNFPGLLLLWRWVFLAGFCWFVLHKNLLWCLHSLEQEGAHWLKFSSSGEWTETLPSLPWRTQSVTVSGVNVLAKATALTTLYQMKHHASKVTRIPLWFFPFFPLYYT